MLGRRISVAIACIMCVLVVGCVATQPTNSQPQNPTGDRTAPVAEPAAQNGRPKSYCAARDPRGKQPPTMKLPDLPTFPPPPKPEVVPIRTDPTWLGSGPKPNFVPRVVVVRGIPTRQKVVFITIDDGASRDPRTEALLRKANVPVTVFLVGGIASCEPDFFRRLSKHGIDMDNHTKEHYELRGLPEKKQRDEICSVPPQFQKLFGRKSNLFRPPYGYRAFNADTLKAMQSCKQRYLVLWWQNVHGANIQFLRPGPRTIQPGDIVLLHFQDDFVKGFANLLHQIKAAGLTPARLQDYLPDSAAVVGPPANLAPNPAPGDDIATQQR